MIAINEDIGAVCDWARENGLLLNVNKTQAIIFSNHALRNAIPNVQIGGTLVNYVQKVRNLGVTMDAKFSFSDHVNDLSSKVFSRLRSLWPNYFILSWQTRLTLVKTLILPLFTYCDTVYSTNLNAKSIRVIERAFAACVRFVFAIGRRDSIDDHVNRVLGCPIMDFLKYRSLVFMYKLLIKNAPEYLYEKIQSSTRSNLLILPRHTSSQYNKSFFVSAASRYNMLPNVVKLSSTIGTFKGRCWEYSTRSS